MPATRLTAATRTWPGRAGILATAFGLIALGTTSASAAPLPANCSGTTTVTCTFTYDGLNGDDGSPQTWIVPAGVTSAHVDVYGAQGGGVGGLGGHTAGTVGLTPGATVTILVGGVGTIDHGGYNGGGSVNEGGGGASDVRIGGTGLTDRVLVAGGGGGSTVYCWPDGGCAVAGAGGGTTGGDGTTTPNAANPVGGGGGTQTAGGPAAGGATGGSLGTGGNAVVGGPYGLGGSGGGGYYGGAGGGDPSTDGDGYATGGGGGSGYVDPSVVTGGSTVSGVVQGPGEVILTYTNRGTGTGKPALRIHDETVQQGVTGTRTVLFPVALSRAVKVPVLVHWRTVDASAKAGEDFVAASGTLTIPAGQLGRTVPVTVKGERGKERTEYFTVVLSSPVNATIADGTGRGTILSHG